VSLASVIRYTWGQCTYGANLLASWLPQNLGDAWEWFANYQGPKSSRPVPGAVVVYGRGGLYNRDYGHVAFVEKVNSDGTFIVKEMNNAVNGGGFGRFDERTSTMQGVEGFLLPPAGVSAMPDSNSGSGGLNPGDLLLGAAGAAPGALFGAAGSVAGGAFQDALGWFLGVIGDVAGLVFKAAAGGAGALTGSLINYSVAESRKHIVALAVAAVVLVVAFT